MIDILHIQKGDMVVYIPRATAGGPPFKSLGIYQNFTFSFSQREPPVELCLNLIGQEERNKGLKIQMVNSANVRRFLRRMVGASARNMGIELADLHKMA